jgi:hypothetical protein
MSVLVMMLSEQRTADAGSRRRLTGRPLQQI